MKDDLIALLKWFEAATTQAAAAAISKEHSANSAYFDGKAAAMHAAASKVRSVLLEPGKVRDLHMGQRCENCAFRGEGPYAYSYRCLRRAPAIDTTPGQQAYGVHLPAWPTMKFDDWCGEWQLPPVALQQQPPETATSSAKDVDRRNR